MAVTRRSQVRSCWIDPLSPQNADYPVSFNLKEEPPIVFLISDRHAIRLRRIITELVNHPPVLRELVHPTGIENLN